MIGENTLTATVKKEISSDKNWKEAFWETALWRVNATHRVTLFCSLISLLTQFSWNLQWDISLPNEAYCDKGNIFRWKVEKLSEKPLCDVWIQISELQLYFMELFASPVLLNLRTDISDHLVEYTAKGNIPRKKRERSFLRNVFLNSEFISQSSTFLFL